MRTHPIRCGDGSVPATTDGQDNPFGRRENPEIRLSIVLTCARLIIIINTAVDEDREQ